VARVTEVTDQFEVLLLRHLFMVITDSGDEVLLLGRGEALPLVHRLQELLAASLSLLAASWSFLA